MPLTPEERAEITRTAIEEARLRAPLALELRQLRADLLDILPRPAAGSSGPKPQSLGDLLRDTRYDLQRVARPVVAVSGQANAGKTSLINRITGFPPNAALPVDVVPTTARPVRIRGGKEALHVRTKEGFQTSALTQEGMTNAIRSKDQGIRYVFVDHPKMRLVSWDWLDLPGTNALGPSPAPIAQQAREVADLCVYVTPATSPLSLLDIHRLMQLGTAFGRTTLCVVVNRIDAIDPKARDRLEAHVRSSLTEALPGVPLSVFFVSAKTGRGLDALREWLARQVCAIQRERLDAEIKSARVLFRDLDKLAGMRGLARVQVTTIHALRERMHGVVVDGLTKAKRELPDVAEHTLRAITAQLPGTQRDLHRSFHGSLHQYLRRETRGISEALDGLLRSVLRQDVTDETELESVANCLEVLWTLGVPDVFDKDTAIAAAVGTATLTAVFAPLVGPALLGVALGVGALGGFLGGLMGDGTDISNPAELRAVVCDPVTASMLSQLNAAAPRSQHQINQLCDLMLRAVEIFAAPESRDFDPAHLRKLIKIAQSKVTEINRNIDRRPESEA